jgi:hypothetical protein
LHAVPPGKKGEKGIHHNPFPLWGGKEISAEGRKSRGKVEEKKEVTVKQFHSHLVAVK